MRGQGSMLGWGSSRGPAGAGAESGPGRGSVWPPSHQAPQSGRGGLPEVRPATRALQEAPLLLRLRRLLSRGRKDQETEARSPGHGQGHTMARV